MDWELDFPKISKRVLWMARDLDDTRPAAALEANGATLVRGQGKLVDQRTVEVGDERFVARQSLVIANGSTAAIPPISGLDTVDYWTNRQAAVPRELPISLAILGGAPSASSSGRHLPLRLQGFNRRAGPRFLGLEEPRRRRAASAPGGGWHRAFHRRPLRRGREDRLGCPGEIEVRRERRG